MATYTIDDLLQLMARLRHPQRGCPWDLQQSPRTIINHSIEEVYELADAIEREQPAAVSDELGDLLFQVVFLARLGEEEGAFDFAGVVQGLCDKLLRRHPHVFANGKLYEKEQNGTQIDTQKARPEAALDKAPLENTQAESGKHESSPVDAGQVSSKWEAIKRDERRARCQNGLFDDIPLALPAMLRARKLQKRAAGIGLDWPDAQGALLSLKRELAEFEAELPAAASTSPASADASALDRLTAELGDLLFSCVNVARKLDINPEQALRGANEKFRQRAVCVEQSLAQLGYTGDSGRELPGAEHIDRLWQAAKQQE